MATKSTAIIRVLVVGECGDGKTTLVNGLKHPDAPAGETGKAARGVTKEIRVVMGMELKPGVLLEIWDTPGVGDKDVTVMQLVALIEAGLENTALTDGGLDGIVVTTPIPDGRVKLGAQVVQVLVEKGFVGGDEKWGNIILCGTKLDRVEDGDEHCFDTDVVPLFFASAPNQTGRSVKVSKDDYSPLVRAILGLPKIKVSYQAPSSQVMAGALADKLGVEVGQVQADLDNWRQMISEQQATISGLIEDMNRREQEQAEERRRRDDQLSEMQRKLERNFEDAQKRLQQERQEAREEREKLLAESQRQHSALLAQQAEDRKKESEARQKEQQKLMDQLQKQMSDAASEREKLMQAEKKAIKDKYEAVEKAKKEAAEESSCSIM